MMSSLYEGDVRRCRRCKRRRMDDEPPEVQQYKTCAKCRIIERTKKKSRKPLAEETMRYGMRQFQEQSQNSNFIHDDIFSNDQLMSEMQAAAAAHDAQVLAAATAAQKSGVPQSYSPSQYAMYKQPQGGQYPANVPAQPDASSYSYLYANPGGNYAPSAPVSAQRPSSASAVASPGFQSPSLPQQAQQNVPGSLAPGQGSVSVPGAAPTSSAAAAAIAAAAIKRTDVSLGNSQTLNRSQNHYRQYQQKQQGGDRTRLSAATNCELCNEPLDIDDPMSVMYRLNRSCYSDPYARPNVYSDFNDFLLAVVRDKDVESVTYISELASYLVESLTTTRVINSEEQFRKIMLDSFSSIYVDPLVGSLAPLTFNRSSHNVHDVNNTAPIVSKVSQQYHYTLTPPLRINYTADSEAGSTSVDMTFITETNLIIMKKTTKRATQAYDAVFLRSLDEKMRAKGFTFDEEPTKLYEQLELSISKDQFVKDFKSLQKQVAAIRAIESVKSSGESAHQDLVSEQNGTGAESKPVDDLDAEVSVPVSTQPSAQSEHIESSELSAPSEHTESSEPHKSSEHSEPSVPSESYETSDPQKTSEHPEAEVHASQENPEVNAPGEETSQTAVPEGQVPLEEAGKEEAQEAPIAPAAEATAIEAPATEAPATEAKSEESQEQGELDPAFAS